MSVHAGLRLHDHAQVALNEAGQPSDCPTAHPSNGAQIFEHRLVAEWIGVGHEHDRTGPKFVLDNDGSFFVPLIDRLPMNQVGETQGRVNG